MTTSLEILATAAPGFEDVVCQEIANLAGRSIDGVPGGALLRGDLTDAAGLVLYSRTAARVLVRLGTVPAGSAQELGQRADKLPWSDFLWSGQPLKVRATVRGAKIKRRDVVENKILQCARHGARRRPPKDHGLHRTVQEIVVRVVGNQATISLDAAGLLHRRGYRKATAKAPLRENLAAAILRAAEWHPEEPLIDPFCGSGTFPIEAALVARDIAPGRHLAPALAGWPCTPKRLWEQLLSEETPNPHPAARIQGADRDAGAIRSSTENAKRARVHGDIQWSCSDVREFAVPDCGTGLVIANLPYGKRVGDARKLRGLYGSVGTALRSHVPEWRLAIVCPDKALAGRILPRMEERFRFENGGIPVGFYCGVIPPR